MEKYYRTNNNIKSRSIKNEGLYRTIYDMGEYTNIEGIASIEKTNQIDLTQIQELLRSVEQKDRVINQTPIPEKVETSNVGVALLNEEEKSYDIRDVLSKAKTERGEVKSDYRQLNNTQYNILKKIKLDEPIEEQELKELIHTITNTSMLNKLEDKELSLNLLSSLQAGEETMIRDQEKLANVVAEENEKTENLDATIEEIDKSFFTSSMSFSDEDFEDLKDIKKNLKKNNLSIKALTFLLIVVIISAIGYIVYTIYQ
ncbi:MAG: hypothetical protein PHW32_03000 [Bacilli bacterium]|nr:hypothetical protein [Bacilli bacterium]MDD4283060.1 hypothetical protein [Bacilli bacterium]